MERISVVIPVFNTEEYLARCINSILSQSYTNLDIILVDDGSTDNSGIICDEYAVKDSRVRVIHQENRGVSHARNTGIDLALGEYISFVDADDIITPGYLELLHKTLQGSNATISTTGTAYVHDSKFMINPVTDLNQTIELMSGNDATKNMLYQKKITNSPFAKLYSKELFDTIRFNEKFAIAEDLDINYQLFLQADRVTVNLGKNYLYYQRPGSAMQSSFSAKRIDGLVVTKQLLSEAELHDTHLANSAKNRLFVEALLEASEISYGNKSYKAQFKECVSLIRGLRVGVVRDAESRFRFRFYAGISLVNVHLLILLFIMKKFPKKMYTHLKNRV